MHDVYECDSQQDSTDRRHPGTHAQIHRGIAAFLEFLPQFAPDHVELLLDEVLRFSDRFLDQGSQTGLARGSVAAIPRSSPEIVINASLQATQIICRRRSLN